jgi:hypothetical protein
VAVAGAAGAVRELEDGVYPTSSLIRGRDLEKVTDGPWAGRDAPEGTARAVAADGRRA